MLTGGAQVSGGESRVSRRVELPRRSRALARSPNGPPIFGGLPQTPGASPWWSHRLPTYMSRSLPLPAEWLSYIYLPTALALLIVSWHFEHPLLPPLLPPHLHRHGQEEDHC
jgi:hypothetical protein